MERSNYDQGTDQKEISLIWHIKKLWNKRSTIAIVTVICILLGCLYTFVLSKDTYQSKATLVAKVDEEAGYTIENYKKQLKSQELLDTTIKSLGMNINADTLRGMIGVSSTDANINVTVNSTDHETSVKVANALSENFIPFITKIANEKSEAEIESISDQVEEAKSNLLKQSALLNDYIKQHPESSYLGLDIEGLEEQVAKYQSDLIEIDRNLLVYESMLSALYDRAEQLGLNISNKISLPDDTINVSYPAYRKLDRASLIKEITNTETEFSKATAEKEATVIAIGDTKNLIYEKQSGQASAEYEYNYLNNNYKTALDRYLTCQKQLMDTKNGASADFGETHLSITSSAKTSIVIKPNHIKNLAIALAVGLILGVAIIYICDYFPKICFKKEQKDKAIE